VENLLGGVGKGAYIAFNILNAGRFKLGAGTLGAAKDSLKGATQYALERQQFGRAIASFGLIQHKLAEMAARIFAGESAVYRTAALMEAVFETGEMIDSTTPPFPRGLDEFALECSIIKVACSEILDDVADEALQIHGGYGYTEEFPAARACRDSRINRIFEGTNEINRLFIPGLLMRRAQRGRLPLVQAMADVGRGLMDLPPLEENAGADDLARGRGLTANAKKLVLFLAGLAYKRFGDKLADEQEVAAGLSDMIIDIFLAESALLRATKAREQGHGTAAALNLALIFTNDAAERWGFQARRVLPVISEDDELRIHLGIVRRLLRWQPLNGVGMRRWIAHRLCEAGSYPALLSIKEGRPPSRAAENERVC
jgi:hypothetical protein